jgi:hypothetical protein
MEGLEPTRLAAPDPKSGSATNYDTSAFGFANVHKKPKASYLRAHLVGFRVYTCRWTCFPADVLQNNLRKMQIKSLIVQILQKGRFVFASYAAKSNNCEFAKPVCNTPFTQEK